ncbi:hypothetical protein WJX81_008662 [Elliptochloris bilobata]|uniref:RRP15-like protein n=1 Tax=Elliptochloris bilobata TaxID=381761 RepID=A0AAW1RGX2_9CHLO
MEVAQLAALRENAADGFEPSYYERSGSDDSDDLGDAEFERAAAAGAAGPGGDDRDSDGAGLLSGEATASGSDSDGPIPGSPHDHKATGGDSKAASFARAFAKVMGGAAGGGAAAAAPILAGSKSLGKRKREEAEAERSDRAARKLRADMRRRGHIVVKKKGDDPASDAAEKALMKTATRGVVRLFNAVAKAQRAQREAAGGGARGRAARLSKSGFLAELRGAAPDAAGGAAAAPGPAAPNLKPAPAASAPSAEGAPAGGKGWAVLREGGPGSGLGLAGVPGSGVRMRDWDTRAGSSDEEAAPDGLGLGSAGMEDGSGSDSDDGSW